VLHSCPARDASRPDDRVEIRVVTRARDQQPFVQPLVPFLYWLKPDIEIQIDVENRVSHYLFSDRGQQRQYVY